jgi:ubiquitin-conjugating enzyme (huntingtin interacting protein 2)
MLLENPNPSDPQDAEVANMLLTDPDSFVLMAHEWAVRYAGAPQQQNIDTTRFRSLARLPALAVDERRYALSNKKRSRKEKKTDSK